MRPESNEQEEPIKRRKTTGRRRAACQTCSLRKVRCSNERPVCSQCRDTASECTYDTLADKSITLDGVVQILSSQIHDLSQQMAALSKVNTNEAVPPIAVTSSVPLGQIRDRSGSNETFQSAQHFKDFAHIPPHRTTADEVLIWPIFDNAYPTNSFIQYYLGGSATSINHNGQAIDEEIEIVPYSSEVPPLDEHKIPHLVNSFLINVHTKNPILDVETLVRKSREYAVRGLGWDGYSCLLLLACALGMIAKPFGTEHAAIDLDMPIDQARQLASPVVDKCKADNCFISATRRLGGFRPSMSTAHCYFFAGGM